MVFIFTDNRCFLCQKAKNWLDFHHIKYQEKNLSIFKLNESYIDLILSYENVDFNSIISTRSKVFKNQKKNLFSMTIDQIKKIIVKNPNILKKPIICDKKNVVIGYNKEDMRIFIPKKLRQYIIANDIHFKYKDYASIIKQYY
ncbi:ArsC/Spx/MgsR family protein ['Camptotheca acuminata' phytoplasma]|uniref:ArsC/Spx/MgsR family protein n=1 Tax='Camptotheca acuminata' phytoplasma TaxID=3239192 RepID=UPI00351A46FD